MFTSVITKTQLRVLHTGRYITEGDDELCRRLPTQNAIRRILCRTEGVECRILIDDLPANVDALAFPGEALADELNDDLLKEDPT